MADKRRVDSLAVDFLLFAGLLATGAYVIRQVISNVIADPEREKHEQASLRAKAHLERLQRENDRKRSADNGSEDASQRGPRVEDLALNQYENIVAMDMVASQDIHVGFNDIGGLDGIIEELKESVIYPLTMPQLYSHGGALLSAPSGVLLYGPPGCGKTMLAKALARESGASFINLHISTLLEKWYGDSNKLVRAVFTLARKMQPAIIFIDEIDAVLRMRANSDHEASAMVKAEFMTLWDGLTSASSSGLPARIVVLGATNRIHDIDEAILRRMPKKFAVALPGAEQRRRILQLVLSDTKTDPEEFNLDYIVKVTAGMSGSDLKEACRDAAMAPVREYIRANRDGAVQSRSINPDHIRGIRTQDFFGRMGGQTPGTGAHKESSESTARAEKGSSNEEVDFEAESLG